jgi:hypothetical protein
MLGHKAPKIVTGHNFLDTPQSFLETSHTQQTARSSFSSISKELFQSLQWRQPVLVVSLFIFGTLLAIAHHFYYTSLDNLPVSSASTFSQEWSLRIGTGLAYLAISLFHSAVVLCLVQQLWESLRSNAVSISGIDKMFSLSSDPTSFFSRELFKFAKLGIFIALISWYV